MNYTKQYNIYLNEFEGALQSFAQGLPGAPAPLAHAMQYSLLSGGKRIRPVLFFAFLELFGITPSREVPLAIAMECIHTYSLIHDDLPAMDNDDMRRGRPSNHKVYGEANAILAGDGLLSEAFHVMLQESMRSTRHLHAALALSDAAGIRGMVAGQTEDLMQQGKAANQEVLFSIYQKKTGRLLAAGPEMAAILADMRLKEASQFGRDLGFLFQITDDLLDIRGDKALLGKSTGKDEQEDKLTCIKLYGVDGAERLADDYTDRCLNLLSALGKPKFLEEMVLNIRTRNH